MQEKTKKKQKEIKRNEKSSKKSSKGITLIALVITIIVLLILAGATIATLTGDNGILTRANEAKNKTEQAEKDEKTNLAQTEDIINEYVNGIEVEQVTDGNPGVLETEGTDTYVINSIEDLVVFAYNVREGNTYEGQTVKLGLSLDFNSTKSYVDPLRTDYGQYGYDGELKTLLTSGEGFKPIGTTTLYSAGKDSSFIGTFDGNDKKIYNVSIKYEANLGSGVGLFGNNYGEIKNLEIINSNFNITSKSATSFLGGIVGYNYGNINNCGSNGTITFSLSGGNIYLGGITGRNDTNSNIKVCFNKANISGKAIDNYEGNVRIGGICGDGNGNIEKCYNEGNINSRTNGAENALGGISGTFGGNIQSSYNIGNIEGYNSLKSVSAVGISNGNGIINNCYNVGTIISIVDADNNAHSAGICNNGQATNCYNIGEIISNSKGAAYSRASGITISEVCDNCYNIGSIKAIGGDNTEIQMGGITTNTKGKDMSNCYNIGKITFEGGNIVRIGAILGLGGESGSITNCSYLASTAEKGMGTGTDVTTRINNIEDMPNILSILGSEFKEDTNNINNGYPILNWQ